MPVDPYRQINSQTSPFQLQYREEAKKEFNNYSIVTDTPAYVTAILGHTWASEVRQLHFQHVYL